MPLTHKNLAASLGNIVATYELRPKDRSLLVMPLFHVHGLMAGALARPNTCLARPDERLPCMQLLSGPVLAKTPAYS